MKFSLVSALSCRSSLPRLVLMIVATQGANLFGKTNNAAPASKPKNSRNAAIANSYYASLLEPLNIFAPPPGAKKLITLPELHSLVQTRGVALKVSRETYNASKQSVTTTEDAKRPVVSFTGGHTNTWTKTKVDGDPMDGVTDRNGETGSHTFGHSAGFSLSGEPLSGVSYRVSFPNLTTSKRSPDTASHDPYLPDSGAFNASLDVALLKGSPYFVESLNARKTRLQLSTARDALKQDVIRKISEAENSFYGLAKRYLNLAVQERSLKLAEALVSDVKEKIAAGEASDLEFTRANLQKAQADTDFMSSQIEYESAVAEFRRGLAFDDADGQGVFPDPRALDIKVEKLGIPKNALEILRRSNPEILAAKNASESAEIELEQARKSTMPSLGLSTSYGNTVPENGWGRATSQALKPNDRTVTFNLTYSQVLYNDTSKNALKSAIVAKQKADLGVDEAQRKAKRDFDALLKRIDIGTRRYQIAKVSREIAEDKINAEYERFRAGESSVRNVIDSQTEVNSARISEISSRVDLAAAYGELNALLGKLPDGVTLTY
jgi:outer membrane protein TolC